VGEEWAYYFRHYIFFQWKKIEKKNEGFKIAGFGFLNFFCYEVFVSKKRENALIYTTGAGVCVCCGQRSAFSSSLSSAGTLTTAQEGR
jgi:hypothetical protein